MTEEGYKYFAFISYSHKDQQIARKLKKFLQSYHLPSELQKNNPELPKRLRPIFIDESNLIVTGPLAKSLRDHLEVSKFLIVICSPNSAKSEYVNDEVKYFIENGRADRIIPLIVDGVPYSEDLSAECFTPALRDLPRDLQPLGIDYKQFKERNAFLRVIAAMLELKPGTFIPWEERERKKRIIIFSSVAAALIILAGYFTWQNIPHQYYYQSYVYKWEKPVGLFEVKNESDRMKMEYTYRFTVLRGEVKKIERVNSEGKLADPGTVNALTELPVISFISDSTVEYYDRYGRKVFRKVYTADDKTTADFYCGDGSVPYVLPSDMNDFYNPDNLFSHENGNIIRLTLEHDKNGYAVKKIFRRDNHGGQDKRGTPAHDDKGRWGLGYEYDELGRVIKVYSLGRNGENISVRGVYAWCIEYNANMPYPVKDSYVDKNNNLVPGPLNAAFDTLSYDEYCNVKKLSWFDSDGKPVMNTSRNIAGIIYTHDPDNGFLTSVSYYDTELRPCISKEGYFRAEYKYYPGKREAENLYYGVNGERIISSEGYSGERFEYNADGQILREIFMDNDNKPAVSSVLNVYGIKYEYDDGLLRRIDYIDPSGDLMLNKAGIASMILSYDKTEKNRTTGITYKDTHDHKTRTLFGYAEMFMTYNEGNESGRLFYDEEGEPVTDLLGAAKYEYAYKDGKRVSERCFDESGRPVLNSKGYFRCDYEYDDNGFRIWERYYDTQGRRVNLPEGYSAVNYAYDTRGNKISEIYYDVDEHYAVQTDKYYSYGRKYEYDDNGHVISINYMREENEKYQAMSDSQVEDVFFEYDSHGNEIKRYWFNGMGDEVDEMSNAKGNVRIEREYDIYGREIKYSGYKNGSEKANLIQENERDSFGRIIKTRAVNYRGESEDILVRKREYDAFGRCIKESYYDGGDKLIIPVRTYADTGIDYAVRKTQYDIFGNETDIKYYDENEKALTLENRAFHTVKTYDVKGNILSVSYYSDEDGKEPAEFFGFCRTVHKYDSAGRETERSLYDKNGNMLRKLVMSYNSTGKSFRKNTSLETYGADGRHSKDAKTGAFRIEYAYDTYGNICDIWYFDADGEPCRHINADGEADEHHVRRSYDAMGKMLSEEIFDIDDKPFTINGAHKVIFIYNSLGLLHEMDYYGTENNLFARKAVKYDSEGRKTGEEWLDVQ